MKPIKMTTPVVVEPSAFTIGHGDRIMLIGSCFTENIGERLQSLRFPVMINPFGILYNPLSIADALNRCIDEVYIDEGDVVLHDGLYHSWIHHGSFSRKDRQQCIDECNKTLRQANIFLQQCNTLVITLGSAWYYTYGGRVVANCHKVPATSFEKHLSSVEEVVTVLKPVIDRLISRGIRVIFTVSPVRHNAYGAHGNQLGKAVLLLAIEQLMKDYPSQEVAYFPSYEIINDELRDYRFYADDLLHPSAMAEEVIWQRFMQTYMTEATIKDCDAIEKENRRLSHRPLHES